jgi:hypothetical protein
MKKILTILAFIAVFSFVACNDDDDEAKQTTSSSYVDPNPVLYSRLVGTWRSKNYTPYWFDQTFTFYPDSTYKYICWIRNINDTSSFDVNDSITGKCLFNSNTGLLFLYNFNPTDNMLNDSMYVGAPYHSHDTLSLDVLFLRINN